MTQENAKRNTRRILGRVTPDEFVGRTSELQQLVSYPERSSEPRGLLVLLAPLAGVSELLRQTYDELFNRRSEIIPIYFSLAQAEATAVSAAIEFLNTFLLQYIAFRRNSPSLCESSLNLNDLTQLAPPADLEWIQDLVEAFNRERFSNDHKSLVRFCLTAPQRVPQRHGRPFVIIDGVHVASYLNTSVVLGAEMVKAFSRSSLPYALAGLRRQVLDAVHRAGSNFEAIDVLRLERLSEEDARTLLETAARRQGVVVNAETRDLLVQQFEGSPLFITALLQAARDRNASLTTYLECEQLYIDDLMGGHLNRHFGLLMEGIAPEPEVRRALIRGLYDAGVSDNRKSSFESWRRLLRLESKPLERLLQRLHVQELINWDGATVEAGGGPAAWKAYLRIRFRLDVLNEPRAIVVADSIAETLKRAPHTMSRHYRQQSNLRLGDLLARFDCQRVPEILFDYDRFSNAYKGAEAEEIIIGLDQEDALIRLPQVFHLASCAAISPEMEQLGDRERSVVAHAFESASYTDANQIVWLVAELESKTEADRDLTEMWCNRLAVFARCSGFGRTRIWLIASEGFSPEASELLRARDAYGSSRQQFELLAARIGESQSPRPAAEPDEFVMVLPMGQENELVAANVVEQIARRLDFRPEAINQIKTAVVEACINAAEHSFSPDRKIYQRFRVENDKLVITISSRGVVPTNLPAQITEQEASLSEVDDASEQRRGWGLKLIRTLMDEVEFELVDDGTSLRMTKYLRPSSSRSPA